MYDWKIYEKGIRERLFQELGTAGYVSVADSAAETADQREAGFRAGQLHPCGQGRKTVLDSLLFL